MNQQSIFGIEILLGYLAWALCIFAYVRPWLKTMDGAAAQRAIATFHSFRFFGLVFLLPGFVGAALPARWASAVAYGDLATGVLAILALSTVRVRYLYWPLVWAFNLVGLADLVIGTTIGVQSNLAAVAGQLGAAFAIMMLYVPALFWTHILAFYFLLRPERAAQTVSPASFAKTRTA
jgi:hypothetical protein